MKIQRLRFIQILLSSFFAILLLQNNVSGEEAAFWPQEIQTSKGSIMLYLPQIESFKGDTLTSRAAVALKLPNSEGMIFGTIWLVSQMEINRDTRIAHPVKIKVPRVRFTGSTPGSEATLSQLIEEAASSWDLSLSIDRIIPMLELAEKERLASQNLSTDPPRIIFRESPSVLISIDGDPILGKIEGSHLQQIVNTPFFILFESKNKQYYLYGGEKEWFSTSDLTGQWSLLNEVPKEVAVLEPDSKDITPPFSTDELQGAIPEIIVTTSPAELIFTTNAPQLQPVEGTTLEYVSNTESVLIRHSRQWYTLLSGRWFRSDTLNGPWTFLPSDKLPEEFAKIPPDSELGGVRYSIAGTEEATEATFDAYIPQTAKVDRASKGVKVAYDGKPEFAPIPSTNMKYAVNTKEQVILANGQYYACIEGVWYISDQPEGEWEVATERPAEVSKIPPESPLYNVKYVYIYDVQPDVVHVGYLPGYTGTYIYHSTIVYGTGFYYPYWYHRYYYPHRFTWNYGVRYSSFGGWSFGIGYSTHRFTFAFGYGGYHHGHRHGYRLGYGHGYTHGYHRGYSRGVRNGYRAGLHGARHRANIYRTQGRPSVHPAVSRPRLSTDQRNRIKSNYRNDLYTNRKGEVFRNQADGSWKVPKQRSTRPTSPATGIERQNRPSHLNQQQRDSLNRARQARTRGNSRVQNFQKGNQRSGAIRRTPSRTGARAARGGGRR